MEPGPEQLTTRKKFWILGTEEKKVKSGLFKDSANLQALPLSHKPLRVKVVKRHTEGPETYEKMVSITSHQRDAN